MFKKFTGEQTEHHSTIILPTVSLKQLPRLVYHSTTSGIAIILSMMMNFILLKFEKPICHSNKQL